MFCADLVSGTFCLLSGSDLQLYANDAVGLWIVFNIFWNYFLCIITPPVRALHRTHVVLCTARKSSLRS